MRDNKEVKTLKQFLIEEVDEKESKKRTHISHPEDLHLEKGHSGFHHAVKSLVAIHKRLTGGGGSVHISTKWDGAPAIVFGHHPETGKFFVGTKSVFNKKPKINYSEQDIHGNHFTSDELATKLKTALKTLSKVAPPRGIYQADLMHSGDAKLNGNHVEFKPNTITYKVSKDSDHGKRALKTKLGLVVHTKYHGKDFNNLEASHDVDHEAFGKHPDVQYISPNHDLDKVVYHPNARKQFEQHIVNAETAQAKIKENNLAGFPTEHLSRYINHTVRAAFEPTSKGFAEFLKDHPRKAAHVKENEPTYDALFDVHKHLSQAKQTLIDALNSHSGDFESWLGDEKSTPEGFVANAGGQPIKLVNRKGFSKANFAMSQFRKKK